MSRSQQRAQKEISREQARNQAHTQAQRSQFQKDGSLKREYIESLTETTLAQEGKEGTIKLLDNLVTRDWVLSNLKEAEVEEAKWRVVELAKLEIFNMHPPRGSQVQGIRRACMLDDPEENLKALSERDKKVIDNFLHAVFFGRLTRSRDGWQQEQMSKTISVSEMRDKREQKDGLMSGLFGK